MRFFGITLLILGFLWICFVGIRDWVIRAEVLRAMSKRKVDDSTMATINQLLTKLNEQCSSYTFNADCAASLSFQRRSFWLVFGNVGFLGSGRFGTTWSGGKSFYTLADTEQSEWMKENSKVFTPAYMAIPYSVFSIRLSALEAVIDLRQTNSSCS